MLAQSEWPSFLDWMPEGFDSWEAWVAIGTFLVAIATVTLATATFRLARAARRDVDVSMRAATAASESAEATRRSVEVAERSLAAAIRPFLADPVDLSPNVGRGRSGSEIGVRVPVRNVGTGLALIRESRLYHPQLPPHTGMHSTTLGSSLPPRDVAWLRFDVGCEDDAAAAAFERQLVAGGIAVDVRYSDVNGDQASRIEVALEYDESEGWRFRELRLFHGEEVSPYAILPSRSITIAVGPAMETDEAMPITPRGGRTTDESESE